MVFAYISDIHIEFIRRNNIKGSGDNKSNILSQIDIADLFLDQFWRLRNLMKNNDIDIDRIVIAGDISHCIDDLYLFIDRLNAETDVKIIMVLGNHDIWNYTSSFDEEPMYDFGEHYSKTEKEIAEHITKLENVELLRVGDMLELSKDDEHIKIIGDLGYTGYNSNFGAEAGIYRSALFMEEEDQMRTEKWKKYYEKVLSELKDGEDLLVITHTPIEDWYGQHTPDESGKVFYINGHTHGHGGYKTSPTYCDNAQNGYNKSYFDFGLLHTKRVQKLYYSKEQDNGSST